ncbi:hypothetical protein FRC17_001559, partial [Serendipita sp. 399]
AVLAAPVKNTEKTEVTRVEGTHTTDANGVETASDLPTIHHHEEHVREGPHLVRRLTAAEHRAQATVHNTNQATQKAEVARQQTLAASYRTHEASSSDPVTKKAFHDEAARNDKLVTKHTHLAEYERLHAVAHTHEALALENPAQAALNRGFAATARTKAQEHADKAAAIQV